MSNSICIREALPKSSALNIRHVLLGAIGVIACASPAMAISGASLYVVSGPNAGIGVHGAVGGQVTSGTRLYSPSQSAGVDYSIAGAAQTLLDATDGVQQGGSTTDEIGGANRARVWFGSPASSTSLHTSAFEASSVVAVGGGKQIGTGRVLASGEDHALLWSGSAASVVDLHPAGYFVSYGADTDGVQQVGKGLFAVPPPEPAYHALLWTGTAASAVDLHPAGFWDSGAMGVGGGKQVGYAATSFTGPTRAFLWSGTAASAINLHPAGFDNSIAIDTDGVRQVGNVTGRAALWEGTAESFIDLHAHLPAGTWLGSNALSVEGDLIYGYAVDAQGQTHAIVWNMIPEPTSIALIGIAAAMFGRRRA